MELNKRRVIFHRFFNIYNGGTSGGQIKVRDYFEHLKNSESFTPKVFFNPETTWFDNPGNVWTSYRNSKDEIETWELKKNDILLLAGIDWMILNEKQKLNPPIPVINIAHPRHARLQDKRNEFLKYPAIRITKSSLSKSILENYGVNGPVFLIPDAIDPKDIPAPNENPENDILIVGLKNPELAQKIYKSLLFLNNFRKKKLVIKVQLPPKLPTRANFLNLVNNSKTIVFLPLEEKFGSEGFYLPALEAMFMKKLVICPFAIGNIDFCVDGKTCIMPKYNFLSILLSIKKAVNMTGYEREGLITNASEITKNHLLENEQKALINLLNQVDTIWNDKTLFNKT
ncbi:glycosyltransferase [Planktosalinus lacus]|uniref:Uncharacterized protein n=1 Tax=Planktosalinus lacus TaxID=1526573 RepID=A0A8J2VCR1_9FLAO|nr:glycosyltransferase [Planktosalinus lacus]GGE00825.1 hypothetical protein GCM10011312_25300 [Planktosalinus lacus]